MKRFFCTICKRVKRVQNLPSSVTNRLAPQVTDRVGTCSHHIIATNFFSKGLNQKKRSA